MKHLKKLIITLLIIAYLGSLYYQYQKQNSYDLYIRGLINDYVEDSVAYIDTALTNTIKDIERQNLGGDSVLPIAGTTYTLSGSGVSSSATSITLSSLTLTQTGQKLLDADFSDTFYITLEPGNRTRQEIVSCTTVAQNGGGTATLSGCSRGLAPITPYTASTTLQFAHSGGSQVIFSNPPHLYNQFTAKTNDETITGTWTFPTPTGSTEAATKGYVDGGILAGAATSTESVTGISRLATAAQTASSTQTTANTPYVIQAQTATDTPNTATRATRVLMSDMLGYLKQGWLNLTEAFTWTGQQTWNANQNVFTGSAPKVGIGTTTPYAPLSVVGEVVAANFTATTTATSTFVNIQATNNATTTNLWVSGTCTNCATNGYEQISANSSSGSSGTLTATANCSAGKKVVGGGYEFSVTTELSCVNGWCLHTNKPGSNTSWVSAVTCNGTCSSRYVTSYAICVTQ